MAKQKTNREVLNKMIKELSDTDLAIVRERLITVTKNVIDNKDKVIEDMKGGFVSGAWYVDVMERTHNLVKFD